MWAQLPLPKIDKHQVLAGELSMARTHCCSVSQYLISSRRKIPSGVAWEVSVPAFANALENHIVGKARE